LNPSIWLIVLAFLSSAPKSKQSFIIKYLKKILQLFLEVLEWFDLFLLKLEYQYPLEHNFKYILKKISNQIRVIYFATPYPWWFLPPISLAGLEFKGSSMLFSFDFCKCFSSLTCITFRTLSIASGTQLMTWSTSFLLNWNPIFLKTFSK